MPLLFYGNFDFEESLCRPRGATRSRSLERILAELASTWVAVVDSSDIVWSPLAVEETFVEQLVRAGWPRFRMVSSRDDLPPGCHFVPWGWTSEAVAFGQSVDARIVAPPLQAVALVNSRKFSFDLEQSLGVNVALSSVTSCWDELTDAISRIRATGQGWLIKPEFSQAGRGQFRGRAQSFHPDEGSGLDEADSELKRWASRHFDHGERLYVEPQLNAVCEAGLQFHISADAAISFLGVAEMLPSRDGSYAGSIIDDSTEQVDRWSDAIAIGRQAAMTVAQTGYFGPIGIDAMRYRRPDATFALRAIQDINARWTMGRLSLGLRRMIPPQTRAVWRCTKTADGCEQIAKTTLSHHRIVRTTPDVLSGRPLRQNMILITEINRETKSEN